MVGALLRGDAALLARRQQCRASLQGPVRSARVYWDLDNISARSAEHALVIGHRLKRTVHRVTGLQPALSAYANERTVDRLRQRSSGESWQAVLEVLEADLVIAGLEKDAADLLMRRDMIYFAEEYGPTGAVVCVSNDQGFGPALERCNRMGAFTVAVGTYLRNSGFNWSQRPSKLPLPAAANCIVAWHPGRPQQPSAPELALVADWQQRLRSDSPGPVEAPGLRAIKRYKGTCLTRWLNPDRPLSPELAQALPTKKPVNRKPAGSSSCKRGEF